MRPHEKYNSSSQSVDWGLTAAYLLVSPLRAVGYISKKRANDKTDYAKLAEMYNPFQFTLKTERKNVESLLGEPRLVHTNAQNAICYYYWETLKTYQPIAPEHFRIAITYEDDYVTGVYTGDLLDRDVIRDFID